MRPRIVSLLPTLEIAEPKARTFSILRHRQVKSPPSCLASVSCAACVWGLGDRICGMHRYVNAKIQPGEVVLVTNADIYIKGGFTCESLSEHMLPVNTMLIPIREEPPLKSCNHKYNFKGANGDTQTASMNCGCTQNSNGTWRPPAHMCYDSYEAQPACTPVHPLSFAHLPKLEGVTGIPTTKHLHSS